MTVKYGDLVIVSTVNSMLGLVTSLDPKSKSCRVFILETGSNWWLGQGMLKVLCSINENN